MFQQIRGVSKIWRHLGPGGLEKMKVDDKGKGGIDSPKFGVTFLKY